MIEVGGTFGGYRLDQVLCTDTVSTIYRGVTVGRDDAEERPLAVRITRPLRTRVGPDAAAIAEYIQRVTAAVRVSHPALIPVADAGEYDDRVYVASGLFEATALDSYVRDHGRLSPEAAVTLLADLADALDRAHAAGIVHGAIGPRTILVRPPVRGVATAMLRGFGIDVLLARQVRLDRAAIDVPDVAYTAPERLRGAAIDGRADQYALACALYHCLTGHLPFGHDTVGSLIGAHLFTAPPTAALTEADAALGGALSAGMAKKPEQRHDSCMDLLRATGYAASLRPRSLATSAAAAGSDPSAHGQSQPVAWPDDGASSDDPAAMRGPGRRMGRRQPRPLRQPTKVAWPVAAMMVLLGIIATLVLAAVIRGRTADLGGIGLRRPAEVVSGSLAAADDGPESLGIGWHRRVSGEALYAVEVIGADRVVAAWSHGAAALDARDGEFSWRRPVDVGVLTDLVAAADVVALRASKLRAFGTDDGTPAWERADIVDPLNSLSTDGERIYGLGAGRVSPEVLAIDALTGDVNWSFDGGGARIDDGAKVVATDDLVAVVDGDTLWGIDITGPSDRVGRVAATGQTTTADEGQSAPDADEDQPTSADAGGARWRIAVEQPWLDSIALLPDVVAVASRTGQVCAFDPDDGAQRWCAPVSDTSDQAPALIAERDTVAVVHGTRVTALAIESGVPRWTYEAPDELVPLAASTGSQIVVSDVAGGAHGLDLRTGFEVWRASGFGEVTALAATADSVYAGTRSGLLVRLEPPLTETAS